MFLGPWLISSKNTNFGVITWSDYAPAYIRLKDWSSLGKQRAWRLNGALLYDPLRIQDQKEIFQKYIEENNTEGINRSVLWYAGDAVIRGIPVKHHSTKR